MSNLKSFEFQRFIEGVLKTQTKESFLIANQSQFTDFQPDYPFRSYFYGIGLVHEGERLLRVGIEDYQLKAGDLLVIGPGIIRHWLDSKWDSKHTALFFTADLFGPPFNASFLDELRIFWPGIRHVSALNEADFDFFNQVFQTIKSQEKYPKVVAPMIVAVLEKIESLYFDGQFLNQSFSRKQQISKSFCSLINTHYLDQKEVAFYAEKLNITPKYLSEVIKETTGKNPKSIIEQLLMQEAKSLLKQTQMSSKEISYWLGFDDPSYFTKAFKTATGSTPLAYRNQ
jgi:AraC family transcriptional regulator, transcriptional activator of pobA